MKYVIFVVLFFTIFSSVAQTESKKNASNFEMYFEKGYKYLELRKRDSLEFFIKKADSILKIQPDSSNYFRQQVLKASLDIRKNDGDKSIEKLLEAQKFFTHKKDTINLAQTFYSLGVTNYYLNRNLVTIDYFEKGLHFKDKISKKLTTKFLKGLATMKLEKSIISTKNKTSLIKNSIEDFNQVIKIYQEENWIIDEILATTLLAECYIHLEDYGKATALLNKSIGLAKKENDKNTEGFALIKKANIFDRQKKYNDALKTIKIAKNIFKNLDNLSTLNYALFIEKEILTDLKRYKEALNVADLINTNNLTMYNNRFADKVSEMDAIYKTVEKEKEIAQQKEQLLEKELGIKSRNLYTIFLASALLISGIIFFGIFKKNQFKRKQLRKEIDLKDELGIIKTQNRLQEQRLRISRDLHDNVGSQLTFIISSIDNLKYISKDANSKLKNKLSHISSFTSETINELRDTIWAMNKSEISMEDLHTRTLSFIEKAKVAVPEIEFKIVYDIDKNSSFSSLIGMNLFRVIQEAINNAIRYAAAKNITIQISKNKQNFIISILDDGKGFDFNTVNLGNGLSNMEKRMSEIDGKISIISKIDKGTEIKLEIDLENTANDV